MSTRITRNRTKMAPPLPPEIALGTEQTDKKESDKEHKTTKVKDIKSFTHKPKKVLIPNTQHVQFSETISDKNKPSPSPSFETLTTKIQLEPEVVTSKTVVEHGDPTLSVALKMKPSRSKKVPGLDGGETEEIEDLRKKPKWVPSNWEETLDCIRSMRADRTAPVDTMGCERTMEENVEPKVRRYQALVSLMLSSQTKDEVNFAAMGRLKEKGLNIQNVLDMDETELGKLIFPVGFWKKKVNYIKRTTQILRDKYNDDIPETIEGLCSLPGVGPKMGYIALAVGWGKHTGIGVDTHVHRISNRLGWTGLKETKTPENTRIAIEAWLPQEMWPDFNILLVGFGQTICTPVNPKCFTCQANQYCPYGKKEGKLTSKRSAK